MENFRTERNQQTVVPANNNELPGTSRSFADEFLRANGETVVHGEYGEIRLPMGFRFVPHDDELIFILYRKLMKNPVKNSQLVDTNLYLENPRKLTAGLAPVVKNTWYFFTSTDRKYPNGSRPKRGISNSKGYWKATGKDKNIMYKNRHIGYRKALVFYLGDPPKGTKTQWIMHEYRVHKSLLGNHVKDDSSNSMLLDEWVLCKVYIKKQNKKKGDDNGRESPQDDDCAEVDRQNQETLPTPGDNRNTNQPSPLQMTNGDVLSNISNVPGTSTYPMPDSMPVTSNYPVPNSMHETTDYPQPNSMPRTSNYPMPNSMPETRNDPLSNNGLGTGNYPMSNGMHETSNYPLPNNGFETINYPLPNIMPGTGLYSMPNGFSHQSNINGTLDPNVTTDLHGCIDSNAWHDWPNLLGTTNSLPVAPADGQEYRHSMLGANNYAPPIPPANNPQNGVHDQFMPGDHNNTHGPINSPPQTGFPRQFVPGGYYNNVPADGNYLPPVPPANPQNGVYDNQFMPGDNNNMPGPINPPPQTGFPRDQFVPGDHYDNAAGDGNYPPNGFEQLPNWQGGAPQTEFVPGGFTEMLLGGGGYYSQHSTPFDDLGDVIFNDFTDYQDELLHSGDLLENTDDNNLSAEGKPNAGESSGYDHQ